MKKRKSLPHAAAKAVAAFTETGAGPIPSDVQGSYTGTDNLSPDEKPVQDADDLEEAGRMMG